MLTEKHRIAHAETIGAGQTEDCGSARREDGQVTSVFAFLLLTLFLAALELSPVAGVGAPHRGGFCGRARARGRTAQ